MLWFILAFDGLDSDCLCHHSVEIISGHLAQNSIQSVLQNGVALHHGDTDVHILVGNGEVITPDFDTVAIGSGGSYAYAASLALLQNTDLSAAEIARKSLEIASEICVYTNSHITVCEVKEEA